MLETKNLIKIYKPKRGVPVKALDGVSLKFPDKGMVFLLGKSGSGKSTLLNVLGGLDRYDKGEILIKGVSSQKFKQSHFDSYRNTYVGFIFQEYNILEEFSVGANIALALQLQGKKATDAEINAILKEVDLEGYGNRKPNELSGGQKQRVAIARALVKSPEIIMADEPTGALDSATGRQVLETLKRLSADKLVIVVSHDREFAEKYADRIVELADGKVIRDVERIGEPLEEAPKTELEYEDGTVTVPRGYHLTEEDRIAINEYLSACEKGDVTIRQKRERSEENFRPTDPNAVQQRGGTFRLIKSRLPFKYAFPMGASGLKHKKVRLVFTILLSCVAFVMFGLSDTFAAYDHIRTTTRSLIDSEIRYASVEKLIHLHDDEYDYDYNLQAKLNPEDLQKIQQETGVELTGVFRGAQYPDFEAQIGPREDGGYSLYPTSAGGYVEISLEKLTRMGGSLKAGRLPDGTTDEIALSTFLCGRFLEQGYLKTGDEKAERINSCEEMIGKILTLNGTDYTVTGIVETGLEIQRYEGLKKLYDPTESLSNGERLMLYALSQEFDYATENSLAGMLIVGEGKTSALRSSLPQYQEVAGGSWPLQSAPGSEAEVWLIPWQIGSLAENKDLDIFWLDGQERTELTANEIVLPVTYLENVLQTSYPEKYLPSRIEESADPDYSALAALKLQQTKDYYDEASGEMKSEVLQEFRIVGLIRAENLQDEFLLLPDAYVKEHTANTSGTWNTAIGTMPEGYNDVEGFVTFCQNKESGTSYEILNPVCYELSVADEILKILAKVFLWIGVAFAIFAALLLSNFIATSISYKKEEIGILRAIGSRGDDVFRIFFSESFLIAAINFLLSTVGTLGITLLINWYIRRQTGLLITLLSFGPRQVLLLALIRLVIAAAASFLPVKRISSKRPIDAIRNR